MPYMPPFVAPARFTDAAAALDQVKAIYQGGLAHLRESMLRFVDGDELPGRVRACYPFVRVHTHTVARHTPPANAGLSYGFVAGPGRYETTLTRPDLYARYYLDQFRLLLENVVLEKMALVVVVVVKALAMARPPKPPAFTLLFVCIWTFSLPLLEKPSVTP